MYKFNPYKNLALMMGLMTGMMISSGSKIDIDEIGKIIKQEELDFKNYIIKNKNLYRGPYPNYGKDLN